MQPNAYTVHQWFPTGEEFPPREEFHEFRGGISTLQLSYLFSVQQVLRIFLLTLTLSIVISLYICELFSALSQAFVDKLKCHYLTRNSFFPTFIDHVIVVNEDYCSICS